MEPKDPAAYGGPMLSRSIQSPDLEQVLRARDAAWARLVKATAKALAAARTGPYDPTPLIEEGAARQALRDIGVDVDALLGDAA
jgi:hypothetical protein